ncbi:ribonuclease [Streptomyces sp. RB6PN25]|uniref:Ribonuclease n=1 Tax=Streptomyces humicola TaxID=2953240 RepID=A0ABT1Q0A0_9ACTN|nr:ribonuclease domain-containing protein [Streptomyces humicola]MCQ4083304.1 ribonuclease [Streptomyces humicola]
MKMPLRALRSRGSAIVLAGALALGPTTVLAEYAHAAPAPTSVTTAVASDIGTVCKSALPSQADDTLRLIAQGGPFPYPEDGEVFQNYEGVLPSEPSGSYHSYTVVTPGVSNRGARRIVTAQGGTDYYTADHYSTFSTIDFSC